MISIIAISITLFCIANPSQGQPLKPNDKAVKPNDNAIKSNDNAIKSNDKVTKPNVIFILSDDQGVSDLNCYGSKDLITPNLDKLASNGVRFSQFYAAAPVCSPSRAALLTGRFPQRAGLASNASSNEGIAGMPGEQETLGELFKSGGYKTAHIGKWHVGYSKETMPNQQGFDHSFGFMGGCIDNYSHFFYWDGPNRHDLWRNGQEVYEPGKYFPDLMVEEAGSFMEQHKKEPFFIYFALNTPHYPLQGDKKWLDHYKEMPSPRRQYAAFVSSMDERVGMLLTKLDQLGLTENTIVIFQSDHGYSEEVRTFGGGGSAKGLRGSKFSVFEGGIKVPAIISWPKKLPKNIVRTQFATNIDWYPTLAKYCGLKLPNRKIDGRDISSIIESPNSASPHQNFYWQSGGSKENPQWAVREGDWKLIHAPLQADKKELDANGLMLINLKTDTAERVNLSAKHPEIVSKLNNQFEQWAKTVSEQ
ncbi:sulfatase-like hydrolase/transferase [Flavitalea sp.]|nr:sulfatase-like hydrolase/transferase [Flavitalea sp.]